MSVVLNPYAQHKSQLGTIEAGLKTLKNESGLMSDSDFSDMYWAVEKHHRELRLAHLTGKSKDLMEQAEKDTKFYNILIKMLCEVKKLPRKQRKDTLRKVHVWYMGNRHTLASGPKFGKTYSKTDATPSPRVSSSKLKSGSIKTAKSSSGVTPRGSNKENQNLKSDKVTDPTVKETRDDISSMRGLGDSINPPSEPASSRMSMFGNDFLTNRFMMDLPSSKLSWHLDTPGAGGAGGKYGMDGVSNSEWDGPDLELQRIGESSLSHRTFDEHYHSSHQSVPNSSPQSHLGDDSPRSLASGHSSGADVCSTDMMEFHSDARRRISHRNQTSSGSMGGGGGAAGSVQGVSEDQSSAGGYGLPRKMVHSIASLVNPHAKLAESEAIKQEQDYVRENTPFRASSKTSMNRGGPDLSAHIPVLRAVSVSSNKGDHMKSFNSFRQDHLYGQDILSNQGPYFPRAKTTSAMPIIGKVRQSESKIHNQTLEEFYQSADNYSPSHTQRFNSSIRTRSAPAPRAKSAKMSVNQRQKTAQPTQRQTPRKSSTTQKLGKSLLENKLDNDEDIEDEILYSNIDNTTQSVVKLETVVGMIDHVKDEMNYFREKLAPTPMSGFRQPASTSVSSKPLSRPTSTASRKSRPRSSQVRPRSPSPQGRPGTPQDADDIMMGYPEVPSDTLKINVPLNRPHSATVNKAVDWRGKVTPEATKIKSKMRFGGHSYVQKLKPSLRTAGAVSSGKRPKTAPTSVRERWNTKDKEGGENKLLPQVNVQECDRNERVVAQAASNTMTQVDDNDMDRIMNIQHILGSSDSRYGSMNSLFFDEEFLRSMNARYRQSSSMSQLTTASQNKEYLSFSVPIGTPRKSPSDGRVSRQSSKKVEVNLIPEEINERDDGTDNFIPALNLQEDFDETSVLLSSKRQELLDVTSPCVDKQETNDTQNTNYNGISDIIDDTENIVSQTSEQNVEIPGKISNDALQVNGDLVPGDKKEELVDKEVEPTDKEVETVDKETESVKETDETTGDIFVEVTTIPSSGRQKQHQHLPTEKALQALTVSDTWHFQPEVDADGSVLIHADGDSKKDLKDKTLHTYHHQHHQHDLETQSEQEQWVKSIVKPENYCFHCLPDTMTTKVGRSAGRMPGGAQSPAGQVLRMARRQNEHYKKAPPVRTPPSIPSMHNTRKGITTPRQGQQYSTELEHHARKVQSPRHFMQQVVELRKDNCRSAPPGSKQDVDDIMGSLSIVSLRTNSRAQTAPNLPYHKSLDMTQTLPPHAEHVDEDNDDNDDDDTTLTRTPTDVTPDRSKTTTALKTTRQSTSTTTQSIAHIGRPIPQISHVHDPDEVIEAVAIQREAKAAVDIQRIFRGYVCRNSYRKLIWENRKSLEDKQLAMQESQREYNKHRGRKAKIYNRPPLDPALLQWAKDFKSIQSQNLEKRQEKVDIMAKEMLAHQQKTKSKIELIGPHVEIYDIYHPKETGPSKRDMHKAAVCMQRHVRGFLVRRRFEKLRRKATFCGSTWEKIVKDYKNMLVRVQRWHGVDKPVTPFTLPEVHDYMDMRRRYESQFDKKAFGGELELAELSSFFKECDLYPSALEIEEGLDVTTNGQSLKKGNGLKKHEAINLLFYIYVPKATGLENTRQSTWMNPIINGIEAKKLIDSGVVETAPLKPCADLVINSRRERKLKEEAERLKKMEEKNGNDSSDSEENMNKTNNSLNNKQSSGTSKIKKGKKKM
ncbi:hypothetical protein ACF0H5_011282 [Mactra antiquata]